MNRDYVDGEHGDVEMFVGTEIENTPAKGMLTLFVVGEQDTDEIIDICKAKGISHIYLGANHSFVPSTEHGFGQLFDMVEDLTRNGYLVTIDFDYLYLPEIQDALMMGEYENLIPVISVKLPYIEGFNYNTCIKIDDIDFKESNPGVWVHSLHELQSKETFTPWHKYTKDTPL